jgi:hypothetical protein
MMAARHLSTVVPAFAGTTAESVASYFFTWLG